MFLWVIGETQIGGENVDEWGRGKSGNYFFTHGSLAFAFKNKTISKNYYLPKVDFVKVFGKVF